MIIIGDIFFSIIYRIEQKIYLLYQVFPGRQNDFKNTCQTNWKVVIPDE